MNDNANGSAFSDILSPTTERTGPESEDYSIDNSKLFEERVGIDDFATSQEEIGKSERLLKAKNNKIIALSRINNGASLDSSYTQLED
ncbi:hypothetical protein, partial [Salinivibrio kushneri]